MIDRERWQKWEAEQKKSDRHRRVLELVLFIGSGAAVAIIAALIGRGST